MKKYSNLVKYGRHTEFAILNFFYLEFVISDLKNLFIHILELFQQETSN